jgi:hypothetical protein
MATKRNTEEKIDDNNLERVIKLLEPTEEGVKPITKKDACAMLCIAYNTTRLGTLIEKHKEKVARDKARRAQLRGKPATPEDVVYIVKEYLSGEAVSRIADSLYRSTGFVNSVLETNSVPTRATGYDYFKPELIPDAAVRTSFAIGEVVYAARYDSIARIEGMHGNAYRLWLLHERWKEFCYQPAEELASLEHLVKLGVKF